MKKLIFPILFSLPILLTNCGSDSNNNSGESSSGTEPESQGVVVDENVQDDNKKDERMARKQKAKEAIYKYIFEKHVAPVKGGVHSCTLTFDAINDKFDFTFNIQLVETIEVEKEVNGVFDYVEEDVSVTDKMVVSGTWKSTDEEGGAAILSITGQREFIDNYYNMYGDLVSNKVKKDFNDEIAVNYNEEPVKDFFGSKNYLKVSSTEISKSDLEGMSKDEMAYLRNEIFARKGHAFKSDKMKTYFAKQPWYVAYNEDATKTLSEIEKKNADFIKSVEDAK